MVDMEWVGSSCYDGSSSQSAFAWIRPRRVLVSLDTLAAALAFVTTLFLVSIRLESGAARMADGGPVAGLIRRTAARGHHAGVPRPSGDLDAGIARLSAPAEDLPRLTQAPGPR